ncbi:MAG: VCBS repeat-containing protein [Myxococcota bacterium]
MGPPLPVQPRHAFGRLAALSACLLLACGRGDSAPGAPTSGEPNAPSTAAPAPVAAPGAQAGAPAPPAVESPTGGLPSAETIRSDDPRVEAILAERRRLDETVWADELTAQDHERTIVDLWDRLRWATDAMATLGDEPAGALTVGSPGPVEPIEADLVSVPLNAAPRVLDGAATKALAQQLGAGGYRLVESEWHHSRFEPRADGGPRSTFSIVLHVLGPGDNDRLVVKGDILIVWLPGRDERGFVRPKSVDATGLHILRWSRPPVFRTARLPTAVETRIKPPTVPILAWDLDGDGRSELALPRSNELFRNRGNGAFKREKLVAHEVDKQAESVKAALLADLTGDGLPDLLGARSDGPMALWVGEAGGTFPTPPRMLPIEGLTFVNPQAIAAGDVDGDGDLDLWVAQYADPYVGGRMPTPYYDANDGLPSVFLENTGGGQFVDRTEAAGLAPRRFRRTYSASFVDLDADGDLDLLTVNDFAGFDIYHNDGKGSFTDVSPPRAKRSLAFGMAHTFGDFNADGFLDFLVIGMSSSTARRLDGMGLGRAAFEDRQTHRLSMGHGNRLMLGSADGSFREASSDAGIARSGWSWGTSVFDPDGDGDLDVYVANGHTSGKTSADYCTVFWRQDIYSGGNGPDPALDQVFTRHRKVLEAGDLSWNGFEHNHLFLNVGERGYVNVGFLAGVAFEFDSRAVIVDDLDVDGRPDLIVTRDSGTPEGVVVTLARNEWPPPPSWVGVSVPDAPGQPALGATIRVKTSRRLTSTPIVSGDSFRAQHAATRTIALAADEQVDWIEATWADGSVRRTERPAHGRYHALAP